jgi:hypothetical protein
MAYNTRQPEKNPTASADANKTPAPRKPAGVAITDRTGFPHPVRATGYGSNQYAGPVSVKPGERISSDLDISPPAGDPALDQLRENGMRGAKNPALRFQLEDLASGNVPNHPSMSRRGASDGSPGDKVPGRLSNNEGQPVRKPGR